MTQLAITAPSTQRRGVCPTLREPMHTGDGLLARLRPVDEIISPQQLQAVAALAARDGNGQIEITARGNLQVRGLTPGSAADFAAAIEDLMPIDTGLPIEISPLAGLDPHEIADTRPMARAIHTALSRSPVAHLLGPKVTVVLDSGSAWDRHDLGADIRLTAVAPANALRWRLEIGGHLLGPVLDRDAASATLILLSMIADMDGRGRDIDPTTARQQLHAMLLADAAPTPTTRAVDAIAPLADGRFAATIWLPFGAVRADVLGALAGAAHQCGVTDLRLAPHHGLIARCASTPDAAQFHTRAAALGFIVDPADPRRAVSACIGTDGCASGHVAARRLADAATRAEPGFFDGSFALHVSGCAKGCAHPAPALVTLTGNAADIGLILDGSASAPPLLPLQHQSVPAAVSALATLWRDQRALGESVAACFKRLGAARIAAAVRQG